MEIILNELSYRNARSEGEAKVWYDTFFNVSFDIKKEIKQNLSIVFSENPKTKVLHANFTFLKWLSSLEKDNKALVLSMLTQSPIIHDYPYYKFNGTYGQGLGYAFETNNVLISFVSN